MKNTYYALNVVFPQDREFDSYTLNHKAMNEFACDGVEEFALDEARVDEILGDRSYSGGNPPDAMFEEIEALMEQDTREFNYYFTGSESALNAQNWLNYLQENIELISSKLMVKDDEDWNNSWRKNFTPIEIFQDFHIIPSWEKHLPLSGVFLYPGQGFGTGQHETTYLCLKLMHQLLNLDLKSCLDFGCGSGILGLSFFYFHKSAQVDFYDIDILAMENTQMNLEHNHWQEDSHLTLLDVTAPRFKNNYDLVFANILLDALCSEKQTIQKQVAPGGYLILSGLLRAQEKEILEVYSEYKFIHRVAKNDWIALLFKNE